MYRIVIVDDEAIEREALTIMLQNANHNIKVIGEAKNGREAIQIADDLKPDIMMMDIKMPGVNGLEAIQSIKEKHPTMKFIMVSANDTFDYARQAMREGVKEFLLKPSKKDEIMTTLQRVTDEIAFEQNLMRQTEDLKEKFGQALSLMKSEWVMSLLLSHIEEVNQENLRDFLDIDMNKGCAMAIKLTAQDHETSTSKKEWYSQIKAWSENKEGCIIGSMIGDQIPLFLFQRDDSRTPLKARAIKFILELQNMLYYAKPNLLFKAGIGRECERLEQLDTSYQEAVLALENTIGSSSYTHFDDLDIQKIIHPTKMYEDERELLERIKDGDAEKAISSFKTYFEKLVHIKSFPDYLYQQLNDLFVIVSRMLRDMGIEIREERLLLDEHDSKDDLKEKSIRYLQHLIMTLKSWQHIQDEGLLDKAKAFIEEHYVETITLQLVADYIGLSPYYFSKQFKDHTGMTFIDYLTQVRIEKAKELLKRTDQSLKEICFNVGYKDPNYFSRVFKKMTEQSPSQYKKEFVQSLK